MTVMALKTRPNKHPFPIVSWLIMLFQGMNPFNKLSHSHNAILFSTTSGLDWVIDSTSKGVRLQPFSMFKKHNKLVGQKYIESPKTEAQFFNWLYLVLGRDYDSLQIVGLLFKLMGFMSFNKFGGNYKKMTCNEVILNYMEYFTDNKFGDPDNYDLNMTWSVL